jgi:hypothetical protein
MITMTISVKMLKNKPSIPQPNGLRPFTPAMTAHTIAAMMLPIATNIPLIPNRLVGMGYRSQDRICSLQGLLSGDAWLLPALDAL